MTTHIKNGMANKGPLRLCVLLSCGIFLFLSLNPSQSEGSYFSIGLRLLSFVALAVLSMALAGGLPRVNKRLLCALLIFSAYLISINLKDMSFLVVITIVIAVSAGILVSAVNQSDLVRDIFEKICTALLLFWLAALITQVVVYNAVGTMLHIHNMIFPYSHDRGHVGGIFTRYNGTQNEPGTYANWIYGVVFIRSMLIKKIGTRLHFISIMSSIFTLSVWAYMAMPFFVLAAILEDRSAKDAVKLWLGVLISSALIAALVAGVAHDYLTMRLDDGGVSIASKQSVYDYVWYDLSGWIIHGRPLITMPCDGCLAPQDAGVGINAAYYLGMPGVFLMAAFMRKVYWRLSISGLLIAAPLFFAKYFILDPITMMMVMFAFYLRNEMANFGERDGVLIDAFRGP